MGTPARPPAHSRRLLPRGVRSPSARNGRQCPTYGPPHPQRDADAARRCGRDAGQGPAELLLSRRGGEGGGGSGFWTQNLVYQKWPDQIFPVVNFVFSRDGHFGLGRGGRGLGEGPPPWLLIILKKPWGPGIPPAVGADGGRSTSGSFKGDDTEDGGDGLERSSASR